MGIVLTDENYYSEQANRDYMSVSQFKEFAGTLMHTTCEETAYKNAQGILPQIMTKPLLVGSYIDAFYEGTLDNFKNANRNSICTQTSIKKYEKSQNPDDLQLLADFKQAETIIEKTTNDPLFASYMSGQKQVIMTATLFGIEWKIKMDSYHPGDKIVDLKIMKSMDPIWSDKNHMKSDFIRYWGYDIQGAVYQKVVEIVTGQKLPFYIACATKEEPTNIEIIQIDQEYLDDALMFVQQQLPHVLDLKNGVVLPVPCGHCYWCRKAKTLAAPVHMSSIIPASASSDPDDVDMSDCMDDLANETDNASFGTAPVQEPFHLFGNLPN